MSAIQVLYLGNRPGLQQSFQPEELKVEYWREDNPPERKFYDLVITDRPVTCEEGEQLQELARAYTFFATPEAGYSQWNALPQKLFTETDQSAEKFLKTYGVWFFSSSYGEKFEQTAMAVSDFFNGEVFWEGGHALHLTGAFGEDFRQIAYWRNDIPIEPGQTIDLWLEYAKTAGVEIRLKGVMFQAGCLHTILDEFTFTEKDLEQVVQIRSEKNSFVFLSLDARGSGSLEISSLHDRFSRGPFGYFIPGGDRYVTSDREELFCYFDPGDRKPPLNVYFSGYKTREGFEGYRLMKDLGAPILLISDSRLEGGGFYVGSAEYEAMVESAIRHYLEELDFGEEDLILSGISMGSTGALYYGCHLHPHAVIVGKPLVNLGSIASNERLIRPGGFPTSLDVLLRQAGDLTPRSIKTLNDRFWKRFRDADWSGTKLILSYMMEDDYDQRAYEELVECLSDREARIYGRGLHGRHNDNTNGIVQWFVSQFRQTLEEDFGRIQ